MSLDNRNLKVIHQRNVSRAGWADAFNQMASMGEDHLADGDVLPATQFDKEEWKWWPRVSADRGRHSACRQGWYAE
jgi:hypothetical protein